MKRFTYKELYENEESYWWFIGSRYIIFKLLEKYIDYKTKKLRILDIGCGTGLVLQKLNKYGESFGIDNSEEALNFCKIRGLNNIKKADANNIPFNNNTFDVITALDIIEHIKNDTLIFNEIYRILKKGGIILITVPAFKFLWSNHDNVLGHYRRYSKKDFKFKISSTGFTIIKLSYYNCILFPLILIIRKIKNLFFKIKNTNKEKTDIIKLPKIINNFLASILKIESKILNKFSLPFGVSLIAVLKKY